MRETQIHNAMKRASSCREQATFCRDMARTCRSAGLDVLAGKFLAHADDWELSACEWSVDIPPIVN